jgi:hypothetical protein
LDKGDKWTGKKSSQPETGVFIIVKEDGRNLYSDKLFIGREDPGRRKQFLQSHVSLLSVMQMQVCSECEFSCFPHRMIGGSSSGGGWEFSSSPPRPDRLWRPPSLLSNGYQRLFPWGKVAGVVELTIHLHLVPRSRMRGAISQLPNTPPWRGVQLKDWIGTPLSLLYLILSA